MLHRGVTIAAVDDQMADVVLVTEGGILHLHLADPRAVGRACVDQAGPDNECTDENRAEQHRPRENVHRPREDLWHRVVSVLLRTSSHTSKLVAQFNSTVEGHIPHAKSMPPVVAAITPTFSAARSTLRILYGRCADESLVLRSGARSHSHFRASLESFC